MKFERGMDLGNYDFGPDPVTSSPGNSNVPGLLVIGGATATGKSSLAMALAQRLQSVILSADSRQVYREFDIGTAKPSQFDRSQVCHGLIDICDPIHTLTLAEYQRAAQQQIHRCHRQLQQFPLLVGGTGLYIDAIVKGLKIPPVAPQPTLRRQLATLGQTQCHQILADVDPVSARRIHPHDAVRTLRSLEVFYVTGQPISALQGETPPPYPILYIGLDSPPDRLRQRIERRTRSMVAAGLVEEVQRLITRYGPDLPLLQTLGYAEFMAYCQGQSTLEEAITETINHTCQFAKRQRTWFRHRAEAIWFDAEAPDLLEQVWDQISAWIDPCYRQQNTALLSVDGVEVSSASPDQGY